MEEQLNTFSLENYKRAVAGMIAKSNELTATSFLGYSTPRLKKYSEKEVELILESGNVSQIRTLSQHFAETNGLYQQILLHYATLLKYSGILIPQQKNKKKKVKKFEEGYNRGLHILASLHLASLMPEIAYKALTYGLYCGIVLKVDEDQFTLMELPNDYCQSNYRDINGLDIVEFNISYFNTIVNEEKRKLILKAYPKEIQSAWNKYSNGKLQSPWILLTSVPTIYFAFNDKAIPPFANTIIHALKYDSAVETEREKELDEIRKILVQKVPHLSDGRLLFEPDEAEEMHSAAVGMLKGNKNISVLTTYDDVEAIVSRTANDSANTTLEKMLNNVYSQAGVSGQIFSSGGSATLDSSIKNDISFMMLFANKMAWYLSFLLNKELSTYNLMFNYQFLPVGVQNEEKYITSALKMATNGYSFLVPAAAQGISQDDLVSLKELENNVLKLQDSLIPLASSFTQTASKSVNDVGRPKLENEEKSAKTLANEASIDKQTSTTTTTTTNSGGNE